MEKKILEFINDIRELRDLVKIEKLDHNLSLRDDLGFNSFDLAELTVKIEVEYDIDIFSNGIISTVGEILEVLNK